MDDRSILVVVVTIIGGILQVLVRSAGRKHWFTKIAQAFETSIKPNTPVPVGMAANGGSVRIIGQAIGVSDHLVKLLDGVQKNNHAMQFEIGALKVSLDTEKRERADDKVKFQAQLEEKNVEIGVLRTELKKAQDTIGDLEKRWDEQVKSHTDIIARLTARIAELESNQNQKGSET